MEKRPYIKLQVKGDLPTLIYIDQISSIVSLGILGTKIVLKEVVNGQNVEYVFSISFDAIEDEIRKARI
ncbi:MAG: hypothetical protein JWO06_2694 [Bacteroidota bacterium]|nr:hypothetical protein [Bacteroidota bacterium]